MLMDCVQIKKYNLLRYIINDRYKLYIKFNRNSYCLCHKFKGLGFKWSL